MAKKHYVVIKEHDGKIEKFPLKSWLKEHPEAVSSNRDVAQDTSYQLRRDLVKQGWELIDDYDQEVYLVKPDEAGKTDFIDEFLAEDVNEEESEQQAVVEEAQEITFSLERDLQKALRHKITQLENGLSIIDGGKERTVEAGRIDITAADQDNLHVVIELKAGTATPDVIAQILAYMTCVEKEDGKKVRGILIAGDFHKKVVLAARSIPNLQLKKYTFSFKFDSVE